MGDVVYGGGLSLGVTSQVEPHLSSVLLTAERRSMDRTDHV